MSQPAPADRSETSADPKAAIRVDGLGHTYGDQTALADLSFAVEAGQMLAIIGPNGAGKTTLLSILAGVRKPDRGSIAIPGGGISWVPQQVALYRRLSVRENLTLFARLERVDGIEQRVNEMLEQTGLADRGGDQVETLSGGNQQRINIAIGLLSSPAVLLLDEPSAGLDPRQRERLWDFVESLAGRGTTVIFSSHHIHEAERYAGRILVLAEGENLFDGTPAELRAATADRNAGDFEAAFVSFLRQQGH